MLDEVLEMIDDDAEPMTYGSNEEFEDLVVEKAMDVEVLTEYDNLDAAQEAEDEHLDQGDVVDVVAGPSGGVADVADEWTTEFNEVPVLEFLDDVGPTFHLGASVAEVLGHLLPDTLLEDVVEQSNMCAKEITKPAKYSVWMEITLQELKAYIGFCILMGLVPLPELSDYWTSDPYFYYAPIAERIYRHCFMEIARYLHFTNNADIIQ